MTDRPRYKVVEVAPVTDEAIERAVNEWTARGYLFESIHFAMRESSVRPSIAFLFLIERAAD